MVWTYAYTEKLFAITLTYAYTYIYIYIDT